MACTNLQPVLDAAGNAVKLLRNARTGAYLCAVVAPEFYN
jgi:hypothetical protein